MPIEHLHVRHLLRDTFLLVLQDGKRTPRVWLLCENVPLKRLRGLGQRVVRRSCVIWTYADFNVRCSRNVSTCYVVIFRPFEQNRFKIKKQTSFRARVWFSLNATQWTSIKFINFYWYGLLNVLLILFLCILQQ